MCVAKLIPECGPVVTPYYRFVSRCVFRADRRHVWILVADMTLRLCRFCNSCPRYSTQKGHRAFGQL
jgi:hypothetical protein